MSYYAKRERTINGFKVTTIFEEFEEQVGEICIDFETTQEDGTLYLIQNKRLDSLLKISAPSLRALK